MEVILLRFTSFSTHSHSGDIPSWLGILMILVCFLGLLIYFRYKKRVKAEKRKNSDAAKRFFERTKSKYKRRR